MLEIDISGMRMRLRGRSLRAMNFMEQERLQARAAPGAKKPRAAEAEDGTRDRILRTAERLFAERGFSGVSVRELRPRRKSTSPASVITSSNKEGLLSEVYRRHCEPMIEERLRGLEASSRLRGKARVAAIIEAFIRPALRQVEVEGGRPSSACAPCCRARTPSCWKSWWRRISISPAPRSSTCCANACRTCREPTCAGASTSCSARSTTPRRAAPDLGVFERPVQSRQHRRRHQGAGAVS